MTSQARAHWSIPEGVQTKETGPEFAQLKKDILAQYGKDNIWKGWLQVTKLLAEENRRIVERGSSSWAEIDFGDIGRVSEEKIGEIKRTGVVVIRNVFSEAQARQWLSSLGEYLEKNTPAIKGFPEKDPWLYRSYFSPVQNEVRTHPRSLEAQEFLNRLWHGYSANTALPTPLTYADSLRFRRPGGFAATVRPHIDAGSLERWGDETYRRYYDGVFSGDVLSHDPYDITWRIEADSAKYPGKQQSSVFRAFQGWTSLSTSGGGFAKGALAAYPAVGLAIAYVLLRPFFKPPQSGSLDPTEWEWDDSSTFPGAWEGQSQQLSPSTHPHLELEKTLALTPVINPGDAVFWHSDVVHAVDPIHEGPDPATVLYIPAVPLTKRNVEYLQGQKRAALNDGETPPDFAAWGAHYEGGFEGYQSIDTITGPQGRQALGLSRFPGEEYISQWANEILAQG
ncbi:hypothetical protein QQZ08_010962 [Neonectria magnoliae]|uniref:DUF1479-domain-containing protein n=1 Tax=Neonectria magnoliae TaxID=2732573 RepID=A0ABR1HEA3_9HYPO